MKNRWNMIYDIDIPFFDLKMIVSSKIVNKNFCPFRDPSLPQLLPRRPRGCVGLHGRLWPRYEAGGRPVGVWPVPGHHHHRGQVCLGRSYWRSSRRSPRHTLPHHYNRGWQVYTGERDSVSYSGGGTGEVQLQHGVWVTATIISNVFFCKVPHFFSKSPSPSAILRSTTDWKPNTNRTLIATYFYCMQTVCVCTLSWAGWMTPSSSWQMSPPSEPVRPLTSGSVSTARRPPWEQATGGVAIVERIGPD